jgi:hypothetical protein
MSISTGVSTIVRVAFVFALFGIGIAQRTAQAAALSEFNIRSASDPSAAGGIFSRGGSFFGSFVIDQSAYAAGDFTDTIVSWDITTTPGTLGHGGHYQSGGAADVATFEVVQTIFQPDIGQTFYVEKLFFATANPKPLDLLELYFFQPVTTFAGGLVYGDEIDETGTPALWRYISAGSAIVLDPQILAEAPERGCVRLLGLGVAVVFCRRSRLSIQHH